MPEPEGGNGLAWWRDIKETRMARVESAMRRMDEDENGHREL